MLSRLALLRKMVRAFIASLSDFMSKLLGIVYSSVSVIGLEK